MENLTDVKYILDSFLMILMAIFVMWMAAGFAMLEAGLTRTKNNTIVLLKNIALYSVSVIIFYYVGYNLMYGEGNIFLGSGFALSGINYDDHSLMADFFFQVVFVATTASVISGAVAERMKLIPFLLFVVVLLGIIYPIQGHWTWGGSELGGMIAGFSDFAGSTIVHSVGGWAALAGVLLLRSRNGKYGKNGQIRPIQGSNLPLATLGTFILWMGWFGFNGGSQLAMGSKDDIDAIALVIASTNMAAATGAVMMIVITQLKTGKVDLTMVLNGALGGLVAVTAGPDNGMFPAVVEGAIAAILVYIAVQFFDKLKIDDPVGALSVHLVNGIWGTIAVAIFNPEVTMVAQIKGIVVIGLFTFVSSYIVWYLLKVAVGIRVDDEVEYDGLDQHEAGIEAYPEFAKTSFR